MILAMNAIHENEEPTANETLALNEPPLPRHSVVAIARSALLARFLRSEDL